MGEKQSPRCTKRNASIRSEFFKEPSGVRKPPRFRQADSSELSEGFREETTGLCGIWLPYPPAIQQHVGLLLFWNFFLSEKEKSGTFPSCQREKFIKSLIDPPKKHIFAIRFFRENLIKIPRPCRRILLYYCCTSQTEMIVGASERMASFVPFSNTETLPSVISKKFTSGSTSAFTHSIITFFA